ncbi:MULTISPECIES: hypothetical protein [unclassified Microcystis]|uniref:Uncharacterized protein n=1 Tax=Microcystis flos-aquae Mf_QC_C_20070823_S10D TaxID=2486236 RepID=A0A552KLM5_9CHRO|nr:MAG: hypothetical protein EWV65_20540 [Microcystis flos-aquae Ma_QC_C_20070823_S18D]TRV08867.1 MAG: hypothetical protein EWV45_16970 [Microcystis flos-aquae Mf_QC_C_20070823_S10D]TRV26390.1 MAG: hypothetical protein EWV72_07200 [Microcystis flos-aquae Mf_QC_C_20070823_S10]TRV31727.1 MAG: hypothetical protein EWV70_16805 [Microcystis flos-aquae Mf_QC_C_20070823_S20]TRV33891.1 MAG: hypothetical protein EWV71_15645 [Microcystis flos-aquae Mf_QC_C_20070823_S20D]TRV37430.1 MAG: hypothetical prot
MIFRESPLLRRKWVISKGKTDIILMKGYGYQHPENLGDRS